MAEEVVPCGFEAEDFVFTATGLEGFHALADMTKTDAAQDGDGAGIVGGDGGFEAFEVEVGECPAGEAAGGFTGDAVAPEAAADPVAEAGGSCGGVEAQAGTADDDFFFGLVAGDGEVVGAVVGQGGVGGGDPFVGEVAGIGEGDGGEGAADFPVVEQAMQLGGVLGGEGTQGQALGGERGEGGHGGGRMRHWLWSAELWHAPQGLVIDTIMEQYGRAGALGVMRVLFLERSA